MPLSLLRTVRNHSNRWVFVLACILLSGLGGCDGPGNQADQSDPVYRQQLEALSDRLGSLQGAIQQQADQSAAAYQQQLEVLSDRLGALQSAIQQQADQSGAAHQQQLEVFSDRLGSLESAIQQQTAVLHQILEQVSPPQLPPEWENRLKQLEGQAGNVDQWPKDAGEAEQFFEQTSELVTGLPAWAEADYLPRLSLIRWAAMAFVRLNHPTDTSQSLDQLEQLGDEMRDLANARPQGGSEALVQRLREEATELAGKTANGRVQEAIKQAQQYVGGHGLGRRLGGNPDTAPDIASVYEFLGLYEKSDDLVGINVNIASLRKKVYGEMARRQADEQAAVLRAQWQNVKKLAPDRPRYEVAAKMLLQQVVSAHAAFVLEGISTTAYDELESELRRAVKTIESRAAKREERQARLKQSHEQVAVLRAQWQNVKKLASHRPQYEVAARMLLQQMVAVQAAFVLEGVAPTAYKELESELRRAVKTIESRAAKRAEERRAQAMRSYQRWALSKIRAFEAAFQATSNKAAESASILRNDDGGWSDVRYREVRQAMNNHLLPINVALLDLPVQERYQQAFQTGWGKLDGREDQTDVAVAAARVVKKPLREFLKD